MQVISMEIDLGVEYEPCFNRIPDDKKGLAEGRVGRLPCIRRRGICEGH